MPTPKTPTANPSQSSDPSVPFLVSSLLDIVRTRGGLRSNPIPVPTAMDSGDTAETAMEPNVVGESPGDPENLGLQMQLFPKDMPGKWRQSLMGFADSYLCDMDEEEGGADGMRYPREDYVRMWITCEEDLYMERLGGVLERVERMLKKLERRETRFVRAGAVKKRVDDMFEYAVRLATGARVLKDEDAAVRMLTRIGKGAYPSNKVALAHNMLCYLYKKRFSRDPIIENLICVLAFGDLASLHGPLTHCTFTLACFFAPLKGTEMFGSFKPLWEKCDEYRERWGLMLPGEKCCAVCGIVPVRKRDLKRCAGSCLIPRKPLYCGTACQKKHWLTHKKWCSKVLTPTESDLESDQYYSDYDSYDSEEDYDLEDSGSETDEDDEDDSEEWGEDYEEDGRGNLYTTDEGEEDFYESPPRKHTGKHKDGDQGSDSSDGDSSLDVLSPKSKYKHPSNCRCWAKPLEKGQRKRKQVWHDYGDINTEGFVMDIARSVIRLRNT